MCWSGEASTALAVVGLSATAYAAYRKEPAPLWITLGYFSLMEALQAYTYSVIDQCSLPSNQIATLLGYLHIAFQPFFINALSMYFIPREVRERIQGIVYTLCFIATIIMIIQLYPFDWAGECDPRRPLCAKSLCSVSGNWHIAWDVPVNGIWNELSNATIIRSWFYGYAFVAFYLPFLYGSWRIALYHLTLGPALAKLLTDNLNEQPAVWCLLSIGILLIVVKTPVRKFLYVTNFRGWPRKYRRA